MNGGANSRAAARARSQRLRLRAFSAKTILLAVLASVGLAAAGAGTVKAQDARATTLAFDGVDDRVAGPADPTAASTASARTWEAWVKTTAGSGTQTIVGRYRHEVGGAPWWLRIDDGFPRIALQEGSRHNQRWSSVRVDDGQWHHVAAVWVPASRLDIFVDGELVNGTLFGERLGEGLEVIDAIDNASSPITLGAAELPVGGWSYHLDGALDDVRYSSGARYSGSFTPPARLTADADTIGLWALEEGTGTVTASEGVITDPATLINGPSWLSEG